MSSNSNQTHSAPILHSSSDSDLQSSTEHHSDIISPSRKRKSMNADILWTAYIHKDESFYNDDYYDSQIFVADSEVAIVQAILIQLLALCNDDELFYFYESCIKLKLHSLKFFLDTNEQIHTHTKLKDNQEDLLTTRLFHNILSITDYFKFYNDINNCLDQAIISFAVEFEKTIMSTNLNLHAFKASIQNFRAKNLNL